MKRRQSNKVSRFRQRKVVKFVVWLQIFLYYQDNSLPPRGGPTGRPAGAALLLILCPKSAPYEAPTKQVDKHVQPPTQLEIHQ
jgi:hypothetical protein